MSFDELQLIWVHFRNCIQKDEVHFTVVLRLIGSFFFPFSLPFFPFPFFLRGKKKGKGEKKEGKGEKRGGPINLRITVTHLGALHLV